MTDSTPLTDLIGMAQEWVDFLEADPENGDDCGPHVLGCYPAAIRKLLPAAREAALGDTPRLESMTLLGRFVEYVELVDPHLDEMPDCTGCQLVAEHDRYVASLAGQPDSLPDRSLIKRLCGQPVEWRSDGSSIPCVLPAAHEEMHRGPD